ISLDLRTPSKGARLPTPVPTKAGPMPTDEGLGTDDRDHFKDRWKPSIQLDEEQAIVVGEPHPPTDLTAQHSQLLPEGCILCCKAPVRLKWRGQHGQSKK